MYCFRQENKAAAFTTCLVFPPEILRQEVISRQGRLSAAESVLQRSSWSCCPDWWDRGRDRQWGRQLGFTGTWPWPPPRWSSWQGRRRHPLHLWNVQGWRPDDPVWKVHGKKQGVKHVYLGKKASEKSQFLVARKKDAFLFSSLADRLHLF